MTTFSFASSAPTRTRHGVFYWIKRLIAWLILLVIAYNFWILLHVLWWVNHNPDNTSFMREQLSLIRRDEPGAQLQHQWVPYDKISRNLKAALIASEDATFVDHNGFDIKGIQLAFQRNLKAGKIVAGGSTISQQLAKNLFLSASRMPWRKGEEAMITVMLELVLSKERIFEIYLNSIEWGVGVFGAEAAAQHYYNKPASRLSAAQAAKLAAMVPNPRYYDKNRRDGRLLGKTRIILRRMGSSEIPD